MDSYLHNRKIKLGNNWNFFSQKDKTYKWLMVRLIGTLLASSPMRITVEASMFQCLYIFRPMGGLRSQYSSANNDTSSHGQ